MPVELKEKNNQFYIDAGNSIGWDRVRTNFCPTCPLLLDGCEGLIIKTVPIANIQGKTASEIKSKSRCIGQSTV